MNLAGAECRGAFFSTEVKEITELNEQVDLIPVEKCTWKYFAKIGQRKILDGVLSNYIKNNVYKTDCFYLRYPGASKGLYKVSKMFGNKIISEHQSKEIDEIRSYSNQHRFGLKPSDFLSWLLYQKIPRYNERVWGNKFIKSINTAVAVTNEIAEYQRRRGASKTFTIGNGIEVENYEIRNFKPNNKNNIRLLFLKGTSAFAEWNGIDRLIKSIDSYHANNGVKFELIICGHIIKDEIRERDYLKHLGYVKGIELNEIINNIDIGVSTLSLHKKNLFEATVLKSREYFARGLPFIYAYTDPDFDESTSKYALQFSNDDSPIDMERVVAFTERVLSNPEHAQEMRKYAKEHLDFSVKMENLVRRLEAIVVND